MLLQVKPRVINGETVLQFYKVGGERHLVKAPFPPYFYSPHQMPAGSSIATSRILLSTLQKQALYKVSFPTTWALAKSRNFASSLSLGEGRH
ncbi:hypothetical protein MUP01_12885 [Candidatus Bathyarchaeota archaeon]|nr:hypothetical protein [Candidatus Bathyarchaeota archaeon]